MFRVAVIIPCFNHGRTLNETVDSVLSQTFVDLEIVIVDDGSTDPLTIDLVSAYRRERTRVIRKPNGGPSSARNLGIRESSGAFILPLDADDLIEPTYVEKAVAVLESDASTGIVYCKADYIGARTGPWELPEFKWPDALWVNPIFVSAVFRRSDWEAVDGYAQTGRDTWEDWDFWLTLTERGVGVHRIPETLFHYRIADAPSRTTVFASRRARDVAYAELIRRHARLYARHVVALYGRRELLERCEGAAARVALTAMTQARPVASYPRRAIAAANLLGWSAFAPTRK